MKIPDTLEHMFELQRQLASNWIPIEKISKSSFPEDERQRHLIAYVALLQEESIELLRELPARKFWRIAAAQKPVKWDCVKDELADIWHIVIALTLIAGMDAEQMHKEYCRKNAINQDRVKHKM